VDEAHAIGVYGERGTGLIEASGVSRDVLVSINPAGKALGVGGACVTGAAWAIEYLVQRARPFVFSTASPPAMAHALLESLNVVRDEPERRVRLQLLSSGLRARLADAGHQVTQGPSHIVPVVIGSNEAALAVASALQVDRFDVRAIRPPTVPVGTSRLRVSVNVGLDEVTLDRFVERLTVAMKGTGAC
jgi:8-amino-7-oxononanoate synthase